jgi:hypothetical protein
MHHDHARGVIHADVATPCAVAVEDDGESERIESARMMASRRGSGIN